MARPNNKEMDKETAQVRRDPSLELDAARAPMTVCWAVSLQKCSLRKLMLPPL